jgi:hypothetical protein
VPNLSTLVDQFTGGTLNATRWPDSYGGATQSGGQAIVPCAAGADSYAGVQSAAAYTFDQVHAQVFPAATAGATSSGDDSECYTAITVSSPSAADGTDISMICNRLTGQLMCFNRTDYWDDTATTGNGGLLTYNATTHAWWRLRRNGSNLLFETAPDSSGSPGTWTTRRTVTAPSWLTAATDCALILEAHRTSGTDNTAAFDNVNTTAGASLGVEGAAEASLGALTAQASGSSIHNRSGSATAEMGALSAAATDGHVLLRRLVKITVGGVSRVVDLVPG